MRAAGGEVYAITSEPHSLAVNAQEDWKTDMIHVGDPHHEIARDCHDRGWLGLVTGEWFGDAVGIKPDWVSHPKGYFQPGTLAVSREGRVLYRWRCIPNRQNVGGAIARPTPEHVWSQLEPALTAGPDAGDAPHDDEAILDAPAAPWPLFVSLLVANGWFVRPQAFNLQAGERNDANDRIKRAQVRLGIFVAAWIAAALVLPAALVTLAALGYAAWITPKVRQVNRHFANLPADTTSSFDAATSSTPTTPKTPTAQESPTP